MPSVMAKAIAGELAKQLKKHDHINASDDGSAVIVRCHLIERLWHQIKYKFPAHFGLR